MSNNKKQKNQLKDQKRSFDNLVKTLLSVPPKENKNIKEKTRKERKKKESK